MKMLKAKLYELELMKRNSEKDALEATKSDIGWGSQIRSYVLDQSRIKDLRTGIERTDTQKVLGRRPGRIRRGQPESRPYRRRRPQSIKLKEKP